MASNRRLPRQLLAVILVGVVVIAVAATVVADAAVRHPQQRNAIAYVSYFKYDFLMAVSKVSLSIEEDVLAEARDRAGRRELSSYVNEALLRQLQHDRIQDLLAEMELASGPMPDDVMEEARQVWRGPDRSSTRRRRSD